MPCPTQRLICSAFGWHISGRLRDVASVIPYGRPFSGFVGVQRLDTCVRRPQQISTTFQKHISMGEGEALPSPFTIHYSPFTIHHSPFTIHHSLFTIHYSPFTIHYSPFTIHHSLFTIHYSLFTIHHSLFTIHHSPNLPYFPLYISDKKW